VLGAAFAAGRYRDVASHSSFESASRELNSPSLTQQARNTWLWVDGRSQRRACINVVPSSQKSAKKPQGPQSGLFSIGELF
jgi:hypothetical protein